jgi:hypothetical protein
MELSFDEQSNTKKRRKNIHGVSRKIIGIIGTPTSFYLTSSTKL